MAGRPAIEITPEMIKKAESLAAQGLTQEQIASVLGIGKSTFYEKVKQYPELLEAIKEGKDKGIATIANALFNKAKSGDNTAMIFYLKARAGWRDVMAIESGTGNISIEIVKPNGAD